MDIIKVLKSKLACAIMLGIAAILVLALIVFAFVDLQISQALYDDSSAFGIFFRDYGEIPLYLMFSFLGVALGLHFRHIATRLCFLIALLANYLWLGALTDNLFAIVSLILVITAGQAIIYYFCPKSVKERLLYALIITAVAMLFANLTVHFFKILWGRIRFRNLSEDFSDFSMWLVPQGITGHKSFPSGHTTAACACLVFVVYALSQKNKLLSAALSAFAVIYIVCVALSRIIMGAHYASDVTFAMLMSGAYLYLSAFLYQKAQAFLQTRRKSVDKD